MKSFDDIESDKERYLMKEPHCYISHNGSQNELLGNIQYEIMLSHFLPS